MTDSLPLTATMPLETDAETLLVERVRGGDHGAYEELVSRHERVVLGLARRLLHDEDAAREVAQGAFVVAFERLGALRDGATFRAWVIAIALNRARDALRARRRVAPAGDAPEPSAPAIGSARLEDAERRRHLAAAVDKLPPRQREVLELRVHEELSFREIGEVVGSTENAAKVSYHLAVKRLRALLTPPGSAPGDAP